MTFANPHALWLLLALPPVLLAFFWWAGRKRQQLLTQFIQARLLPGLTVGISPAREKIRAACLVSAVACLLLALARPQWGFDWEEVKQRGLDIVVAIDTSKSMLATDVAPNRLARAKLAALDLMKRAKTDRLGLVAFAGSAFLQCPLTIDDSAFRQSVEALDVNIIPQGGTALVDAIQTALTAYKEGDNYKVLVLLTDGEDHDSGALEAAEKAAQEGLRIFTVGIGTSDGEILRVQNSQGGSDYVRDEQGNVVKSHLNEDLLKRIAFTSEGGAYIPLRGAKAIDSLYDDRLASLPKSQHREKFIRRYHERYYWPLAAAIVLLLVEMLFPERKRERPAKRPGAARGMWRRSPGANPAPSAGRETAPASSMLRAQSSLPALLSLLLCAPVAALASPSSALREYKAGNFDQAFKEYQRLLRQNTNDSRLHFNAGAAAYRNRQFEEAARQFNAALSSPDLKLQGLAYYNEGNSLFHLGERSPDPKQRKEAWENALTNYQSAMKLSPQDPDAKFNYEFVKKKLEELKQQQQQNQQQNKDEQQNEDQQQQDQQRQQQDQQKQQDQPDQNQDSSQQQAEQQQKDQEQQQAEQQKQEQQQAQQGSAQPKEESGETNEQDTAAQALGQMTQEQAQQLLDAQKEGEKMLQPKPTGKPRDSRRSLKDW
ncbi:MAG TPA: VWA domain-containing protein [Verrucomicrobiota bacterium]|nr:VWA domain-containing protein [Verrucomicrobiota bacterium]HQL76853.1 VWA domain-containing protein [Verrucomicrobiota bacterium]